MRQKEALKALRAEVDVLTLTATPIPRTLGMALEGLRDFSIIATAPQKRLAIKTFVRSETLGTIREAILRELKRGGQCYFLHNEVDTIKNRLEKLQELIPEARIAIAHGQMPERELEAVMRDFVAQPHQRAAVLHHHRDGHRRAHRQHHRHQPRRQVRAGAAAPAARTRRPLAPPSLRLPDGARHRGPHQAGGATSRRDPGDGGAGSGFYLAMHDLEIRGAGEVLGEHQSGNMMEVGFQLYNDMLSEAVRALKSGKEPDLLSPTGAFGGGIDIKLHAPALLPDAYCGDVQTRLSLYKRLATADRPETLDNLLEEITDRFGKLPPQGQTLFDTHRLRVLARSYGVLKVDANPKVMNVTFRANPRSTRCASSSWCRRTRA